MFEWLENTIPPLSSETVEITWTPAEPVASKETLIVSDQRGFKKDLHVIFKSMGKSTLNASRKPLRTRPMGLLTVNNGANARRLRTPSPPPKKRVTGMRTSPHIDLPFKAVHVQRKTTPKRRSVSPQLQQQFQGNFNNHFDDKENSPLFHRGRQNTAEPILNASDVFNNIQFTPAADKNRGLDYMASLPTPKLTEPHHNIPLQQQQQLQPTIINSQQLNGKKIVWSPIFEQIHEEIPLRNREVSKAVLSPLALVNNVRTPEIIVTAVPEEKIQTVSVVLPSNCSPKCLYYLYQGNGESHTTR